MHSVFPFLPIVALLGLAFGSFGNVLLVRFAEGTQVTGRSRCPRCRHTLAWYDLVPLVSYLLLRGRCRYCHTPIALQYPLVELATALLFLLAFFLADGSPFALVGYSLFLWGLLLAGVYDAHSGLLPDVLTAIVFVGALLLRVDTGHYPDAAFGLAVGAGWFAWQWAVSRGRFVGSGDILLAGSIGVALGLWNTITMLVASYILGAVIAVILILAGRATRGSHIPFGPFLVIGTILTLLGAGDLYLSLFTHM